MQIHLSDNARDTIKRVDLVDELYSRVRGVSYPRLFDMVQGLDLSEVEALEKSLMKGRHLFSIPFGEVLSNPS